jgi:hypothetical protein
MRDPQFQIGDDVYVREPTRFIDGIVNITGHVRSFEQTEDGGWTYTIAAFVGRMGGYENPPDGQPMQFAESDLGIRLGTPLSQLSGRPGHHGYDRFCAIAASWGFD